ncbi:concanavalin A-like lectin/glucanase domain-containing protein [Mycena latifolia]|nr:concanavalin A-like lectin/glucanase domain-containing protein [Mycena latifolia]
MYTLVVLSLTFSTFLLSTEAQICNATSLCPAAAPCCSEFGYCGTGNQFCLAGCNPFQSHALDACKPSPICKSTTYTFKDGSRILTNSTLNNGDASKYDWVLDGGAVNVANGELSMLLTETNSGVRLSSTRFIHYGTITATMKTGRWNGVVAGFVTMSNIRDEIDWEFPGAATMEGQTNYFWQGVVASPNHGAASKGLTDTYDNYHDYTIVWSPDSLVFRINNKTVRTIERSDTVVDGVSQFPNTPSRIQLSLWPAGTNASAAGTIQWAGGLINWADKDYVAAGGHFTARVKSVSVKCGDPTPPGASVQGYVYGGTLSSPTITFSDQSVLAGNTTVPVIAPSAGGSMSSASAPALASSSQSSASLGTAATTPSSSASATPVSADGSASGQSSAGTSSDSTITTTLGNNAVSAAPTSASHGGSFFGNGGMDASSVSLRPSALASGSSGSDSATPSASLSGTPTVTQSASMLMSGSSTSAASASKTAAPNATAAREVDARGILAIFVGVLVALL